MIFYSRIVGSDANERVRREMKGSPTSKARYVTFRVTMCFDHTAPSVSRLRCFLVATLKVINGQHELYTLSIAVMLGVRTSIGTTNARMSASNGKHWLTSDDFMASEKYEFSPKVRL